MLEKLLSHASTHLSFKAKPPPTSSASLPAKILLKSSPSPLILGASPLFGALGEAAFLRFSWPAFDGKVGNMAVGFGRGFSVNQGWARTSDALRRFSGFNVSSESRIFAPAAVSRGNLERITEPVVCGVRGSRRPLALGRRRNSGQDSSVGTPHSSKI